MRIFPILPETKIHLFFPRSKSAPINISSQIRTINHRPHLTLPSMSISSMWDVKEPTHYSKRAGHEVPSVVAVLCECMGGTEKVICLTWDLVTCLHITLHFGAKVAKTKTKHAPVNHSIWFWQGLSAGP